jgi:SRSO17 transposase
MALSHWKHGIQSLVELISGVSEDGYAGITNTTVLEIMLLCMEIRFRRRISMAKLSEFERYVNYLCEVLGHQDRHAGFADYSRGLMLPIERKSVEPLAASTDPLHVSSQHQSLHHLVAMSEWSDRAVLKRVRQWVMPRLGQKRGFYWIVDDTGFPKKGEHSVGVARQYCGALGKQDNCQVAVSLSLATEQGSVPIEFQLYLPEKWAKDQRWSRSERRKPPEWQLASCWQMRAMAMKRRGVKRWVRWSWSIVLGCNRSPRYG